MSKKGKRELGMKKEDMLAPFDTLAAYDKLKEVFTEEQARVIVRVMWMRLKMLLRVEWKNNELKGLSPKSLKS